MAYLQQQPAQPLRFHELRTEDSMFCDQRMDSDGMPDAKRHQPALRLPAPLTDETITLAMREMQQGTACAVQSCIECYTGNRMTAEDLISFIRSIAMHSPTLTALFAPKPTVADSDMGESASADDFAALMALSGQPAPAPQRMGESASADDFAALMVSSGQPAPAPQRDIPLTHAAPPPRPAASNPMPSICIDNLRAPATTTEGTKEAARIMALSRNFERMRIAVKVRRERREWREKRRTRREKWRTRRDQPEADEVWRDAPSAPCSEGDDDHSGMHSASSPSSPASILRSASSLSSAGGSSPASRSSVRFRHEISELRYYDCEAGSSHDTQLQLATALSSSQGGVCAPMSSPASMSSSQRLGPSCSSTSACDLELECLNEIVQSDGRVTTEAECLRELEHWLHEVQRLLSTEIPDSV